MNNEKTTRFDLSINALKEIREKIENKIGREVDCINEKTNSRYRFIDKEFNNLTVAYVSFNYDTGEYDNIDYNLEYPEKIKKLLDDQFDFDKIKDLVLINWVNYTMNLITDIAFKKGDGIVRDLRDKLYTNYYIPIKMDEFNYSDALNFNETNARKNLIASYHENLREDIKLFNDELDENYELSNTPYAKALVVLNGRVVEDKDIEVKHNNHVITYVSNKYKIYLPLKLIKDLKNKNIKDKIDYKGETYINSSYINIYE